MKVKHTKLKKSIFLILICISLTTTFVVSTSAEYYPDRFIEVYINDGSNRYLYYSYELGYFSSIDSQYLSFHYASDIESLFPDAGITGFFSSFGFYYGTESEYPGSTPFEYNGLFSHFSVNGISYSIDYVDSSIFPGVLQYDFRFPNPESGNVVIDLYLVVPNHFTDSVGSGLTSSLSWVGQVVESLTTGPIKPLLECFAVTISVSALLLGIYSIRRFIWGS